MKWCLTLAALGVVAVGLAADRPAPLAPCQVSRGDKIEYDWTAGVIRVRGTAPWPGTDDRTRVLARRAAVVDGYRSIGEAIRGVCVTTDFRLAEVAAGSKVVKTRLEAYVQGARVVNEGVDEGEPKEIWVLLEAPLLGADGLSGAVVRPRQPDEPEEPGEPAAPDEPGEPREPGVPDNPVTPVTIEVTGIVIDARPPDERAEDYPLLTPALFPTITDEAGAVLYGPELVDPDVLEAIGGAVYFDVATPTGGAEGTVDLSAAADRIGEKPLWLRGVTVGGATSMLYVPDEGAARLRELRDTPILRRGRVIILRRNATPHDEVPQQPAAAE